MTPEEEEIIRTQALQSAETALVQAEADYAEYRLQLKAMSKHMFWPFKTAMGDREVGH